MIADNNIFQTILRWLLECKFWTWSWFWEKFNGDTWSLEIKGYYVFRWCLYTRNFVFIFDRCFKLYSNITEEGMNWAKQKLEELRQEGYEF